MTGTYDKHGNYQALPSSAEGRVARRIPVERVIDDSRDERPDPIDTFCGPVWVGVACFILLGSAFIWCGMVALWKWLVEVVG